ncbi:MAG: MarR family winged helix-turn-helix transcriptional regulator [Oscillospiraceae bacterium]
MDNSSAKRFMDLHRKFRQMNFSCLTDGKFNQSEFVTMAVMYDHTQDSAGENALKGVGVPMNLISKELGVSPAMISKTIGNLENRGLVERIIDSSDRRGIKVSFTDNGLEFFKRNHDISIKFMSEIFDEMGEENFCRLIELNEQMLGILSRKLSECRENKKRAVE